MENKQQNIVSQTWPWTGLILILLALGPSLLGARLQSPWMAFVYGVLVGMVIVYLGAFIYQAVKAHREKR